jgi:hypothetical protein
MSATTAAVPETPRPIGPFGRVIGVLTDPRPTFTDIARKPNWLLPLVLLTIFGIGLGTILAQRVDWMQVGQRQIERSHFLSQRINQLPPAQREAAYKRQVISGEIGAYVRGAFGAVFLAIVLSAIYLGLFNVSGASLSFLQSFALVSYGLLPLGIRDLLGIPIVLMKDPSAIDPQNFIASNLAAFVPSDAALWKVALAASADIFVLWSVLLMAVAFSAANPKKIGFGKALTITLGVYVFFTLIFTGVAALTS